MNNKQLSVFPTISLAADSSVCSLKNSYVSQNCTLPLDRYVLNMLLIPVMVIFEHFSSSKATAPATTEKFLFGTSDMCYMHSSVQL